MTKAQRVCSTINALIGSLSAIHLFIRGLDFEVSGQTLALCKATYISLASYLNWDLLFGTIFGGLDPLHKIHHTVGVIGMISFYQTEKFPELAMYFLFSELSTPFLNYLWFKKDNPDCYYKIVGITFAITYFFARITPIPYVLYKMYLYTDKILQMSYFSIAQIYLSSTIVMSLNVFWLGKIMKKFT